MTRARCILPGKTYMITRRCIYRMCKLKPCKKVEEIFMFCLASAAKKYGIRIHGYVVISNHIHIIISDPNAVLPRFMQWLCSKVARHLNASRGEWESFWAPGSYNAVVLLDQGAVLKEMVYTRTNAVQHNLVAKSDHWPGVVFHPDDIGKTLTIHRPTGFFREDGPIEESVSLTITKPPFFEDMTEREFSDLLNELVEAEEQKLRRKRKKKGIVLVGSHRIKNQSHKYIPKSREPRRNMKPRVCAGNSVTRIIALRELAEFYDAYVKALERYQAGEHQVEFPAGTYWMRVNCNVNCVPPP